PSLSMPPVTRHALAIYCGASGDHNPLHVDIDFARESGLDDVIAHGMLIMAYMGRTLTNWVSQDAIRSFDTRFQAMTRIGDAITTTGKIVEKFIDGDERCVRVEVSAADQRGEVKALGSVVIALS
ncbi:MAG: MaoC/PaaZ C-terminal domain-containing protein, partial [Proteobacteria bacterium]|nr:MaoC/PaaZ C-terminal domain-containing protein [Pseudomonadota bacterium]